MARRPGPRTLRIVADSRPVLRGPIVRVIERRLLGVFSLTAGAGVPR